jgi:hypothetical protein
VGEQDSCGGKWQSAYFVTTPKLTGLKKWALYSGGFLGALLIGTVMSGDASDLHDEIRFVLIEEFGYQEVPWKKSKPETKRELLKGLGFLLVHGRHRRISLPDCQPRASFR